MGLQIAKNAIWHVVTHSQATRVCVVSMVTWRLNYIETFHRIVQTCPNIGVCGAIAKSTLQQIVLGRGIYSAHSDTGFILSHSERLPP